MPIHSLFEDTTNNAVCKLFNGFDLFAQNLSFGLI